MPPRKTPLRGDGDGLTRRTPLATIGARGRAHQRRMAKLRTAVFDRDRHRCQATIAPLCSGRAEHAHHLWPSGQGGPDELENLAAVCFACHRWIHDHPDESNRLGLLRRIR